MRHSEYIRKVPGSKKAVVLLHGILGSPWHFRELLPLIPEDHSVYAILLDGHGKQVMDFARSSMSLWKKQVSQLLDNVLQEHEEIILVGHSMGTLFAIQESIRHPEKIRHLFLLQCPLRPRVTLKAAIHTALLPFGIITETNRLSHEDCSLTLNPRLWEYLLWLPRFLELFAEAGKTRKLLADITADCHVVQSKKDEMVSMGSYRDLMRHPHLHLTLLPHSGHYGYVSDDLELVQEEFSKLFA